MSNSSNTPAGLLISHGWQQVSREKFLNQAPEAVFTCHNPANALLELAWFPAQSKFWLMVTGPGTGKSALQFDYEIDFSNSLQALIKIQQEVTAENYIGTYFSISGETDVSILAWEQFV